MRKVATSTGTTDYTLHGKNVVHLTNGTNSLHFYYDAQNRPAIVEFNWVPYAYVHNLQGDIIAIVDANGNKVVEYKYDAWGKPIAKTGSLASTLGTLNPFRYRGYVYDEETNLYYLRSRYYSPMLARFINADRLYADNTYCYCLNNPLCYCDYSGLFPERMPVALQDSSTGCCRPPKSIVMSAFLSDSSLDSSTYSLVEWEHRTNYLTPEESEQMSRHLKLAQLPLDSMNYIADCIIEGALGICITVPDYVEHIWDMYGSKSTASDIQNYTETNWSPSGIYHTTVALYWNRELDNYLLYTKTTSIVDSVLCTEGIRGVYPETIDWNRELSLKVVTHGP